MKDKRGGNRCENRALRPRVAPDDLLVRDEGEFWTRRSCGSGRVREKGIARGRSFRWRCVIRKQSIIVSRTSPKGPCCAVIGFGNGYAKAINVIGQRLHPPRNVPALRQTC